MYLVLQMALYLILAALAGVGVGWWFNHLRNRSQAVELQTIQSIDENEDAFSIKNRLDKCFDDNAQLRRELKLSNEQLQKMSKSNIPEPAGSKNTLLEKIQVLMDDLQLRDDTILALEKELEMSRNHN